ncbi:MAG: thioredoxin fold domain-containing protein [Fretibacterium sp.]|nr:thioredoxin fold domain-containing protein [Fretibacterium sp.]
MVNKIENNDTSALEAAAVALLDISATWCQPCKILAPVVEQLSEEFAGKVAFFNADAEENPEVSRRFKVMGIPYLILFKAGEPVGRKVGVQPAEELKSWIESAL